MKGYHTQGDSFDEVLANMKEAVELYVETLSKEEKGYFLGKEILTRCLIPSGIHLMQRIISGL